MDSDSHIFTSNVVKNLAKGDEKAFQAIFDLYYDKLYGYILRFIKSDELTQEVIQEVFIRLWLYRGKIDDQKNFDAYIFRIAKNQTLDFLRSMSKNQARKSTFLEAVEYKNQFRCTIEENLSYTDYLSFAENAVDQLPAQRKMIYQLSREEGMSYQEIAETLHISKNTVKVQMLRALKSIRSYLKTYTDLTLIVILQIIFF